MNAEPAPDLLRRMYRLMRLTRMLNERKIVLARQGKVIGAAFGQGHEAAQVACGLAIRPGYDTVLPYYRDMGVVLAVGMTPKDLLLAAFNRGADPTSHGRQPANHFAHQGLRIITSSSPTGTQIPQACGFGFAAKYRSEDRVAMVFFGDGASSQGDFHEGLNFAAVHRLAVVFVCENNGYSISVPLHKQMAVANVADRAGGYGMPGVVVDGFDPVAVYRAAASAVERARRGDGPTLLEAKVFRFGPHGTDDDDRRYRSREEVERWKELDPLPAFRDRLLRSGVLDEETARAIDGEIAAEIARAEQEAWEAPPPPDEAAWEHVYG